MKGFADIGGKQANEQIKAIGTKAMDGSVPIVAFMIERKRVDPFIGKLLRDFPKLIVVSRESGPTAGIMTIRVTNTGPPTPFVPPVPPGII